MVWVWNEGVSGEFRPNLDWLIVDSFCYGISSEQFIKGIAHRLLILGTIQDFLSDLRSNKIMVNPLVLKLHRDKVLAFYCDLLHERRRRGDGGGSGEFDSVLNHIYIIPSDCDRWKNDLDNP
jgi:hypothetical protein